MESHSLREFKNLYINHCINSQQFSIFWGLKSCWHQKIYMIGKLEWYSKNGVRIWHHFGYDAMMLSISKSIYLWFGITDVMISHPILEDCSVTMMQSPPTSWFDDVEIKNISNIGFQNMIYKHANNFSSKLIPHQFSECSKKFWYY